MVREFKIKKKPGKMKGGGVPTRDVPIPSDLRAKRRAFRKQLRDVGDILGGTPIQGVDYPDPKYANTIAQQREQTKELKRAREELELANERAERAIQGANYYHNAGARIAANNAVQAADNAQAEYNEDEDFYDAEPEVIDLAPAHYVHEINDPDGDDGPDEDYLEDDEDGFYSADEGDDDFYAEGEDYAPDPYVLADGDEYQSPVNVYEPSLMPHIHPPSYINPNHGAAYATPAPLATTTAAPDSGFAETPMRRPPIHLRSFSGASAASPYTSVSTPARDHIARQQSRLGFEQPPHPPLAALSYTPNPNPLGMFPPDYDADFD